MAYESLVNTEVRTSLAEMFAARLCKHFPADRPEILHTDWPAVLARLKSENVRVRIAAPKTWLGGWTTSDRMNEATILPCLAGCRGRLDKWVHYARCPRLWSVVDRVCPNVAANSLASRLALRGTGTQKVSLDKVIKTMWETGNDMKTKYKETSRGGLAVNIIEC